MPQSTDEWCPALAPALMLRHDPVRGTDLLVLPERVVVLKGHGGTVVGLCDGTRTVHGIVGELAERFPGAPVAGTVPAFLDSLRQEGWLK
ncbi:MULTISPECIES: pyrroloquinoline quinone biosynthesis peptide chaperone PqqD [unclassified Streptomyces]|uniref:pyrroloquinoline quinone biosynthesis peptide chaperone PqqD n=1 Tax=unclassified Streptomyces TaxID=2593676 RepID=UPI0006C097D6|nr:MULTISPECIES: pyrroloquinoline quinone biosynthesis peptide chaperone PqqD [unclassified Streptomyces]KOX11148.1 pyrroloquinoline quinone biosynthesis protein PqqD [Streptomyces sp. NRRL B-3648]